MFSFVIAKGEENPMKQPRIVAETHHSSTALLRAARYAAKASYSPYSNFRVGAAVLAGGKVYTGTNVENASYSLTICAERAAIFAAVSDGNKTIDRIAIACVDASKSDPPNVRFPCGACRQVLAEFTAEDSLILIDGWGEATLGCFLPSPFRLK
jgi:cytidine deaminase